MSHFFQPPRFDNQDENIQARVIFLLSEGTAVIILLFVIVSLVALPSLVRRSLFLAGFALPVLGAILWLVTSGRLRAARVLLVAVVWTAVTLGTLTAGSIAAPIALGYLLVITLSRLLSSRRASLYVLLLCLVTLGIMAWAENKGQLPAPRSYTPIERLSIYCFYLIVILGLQNIAADSIKRLLRQVEAGRSNYKSFLENIPTITYICEPGPEARIGYVSPQVKKLLGYVQEDFLKDPALWQKILHPEDRERVLAENTQSLQTGSPFLAEYRLLTREQKVIWVRDEAIQVQDNEDEPPYWLGVWTDITTRKLAEQEQVEMLGVMTKRTIQLQTAAEISRAASSILDINKLLPTVVELIRNHFDYYYVGIFLVDDTKTWAVLRAGTGEMGRQMLWSGHRLSVGDSSMIGWCVSHRQARIALDVGVDAVRFKNPYLPLTRSEMALPLIAHSEVIGAMTIQSRIPAAFSTVDITALQTMADQVANAIENAQLFTERTSLIEELEKRNTELEHFTYTVSHDLRSPLVTMRGFLGYLRQDAHAGDLERFDKDHTRVARAVDRMQSLLNDLLELSRVGRVINPPQDIPFKQVVDETLDLITGPLGIRGVKLQVQEDLPTVHGDHTRLIEIMQNLISNAIKFMGDQPSPVIEIGTAGFDGDRKPILFVRDNGMGIEPEYHERIFGLFNRLHPEIDGTGLGLTLVRRIIEVHGGRIWVDSEPGAGATFYFTLPGGEEHPSHLST